MRQSTGNTLVGVGLAAFLVAGCTPGQTPQERPGITAEPTATPGAEQEICGDLTDIETDQPAEGVLLAKNLGGCAVVLLNEKGTSTATLERNQTFLIRCVVRGVGRPGFRIELTNEGVPNTEGNVFLGVGSPVLGDLQGNKLKPQPKDCPDETN